MLYPPLLTKKLTASGYAVQNTAELWAIQVINKDAANPVTVRVWDYESMTEPSYFETIVPVGGEKFFAWPSPVYITTTLYVEIAGGTATVYVYWRNF